MSDAHHGRTVTLVVSDLAGSTALGEKLDAETLRAILDRYFDEMRSVFSAHGGVIEKIIGDAIVAVFEGDDDREDAISAVQAVADAEEALAALNDTVEQRWGVRLTNRTGVATGDLLLERLAAGHSVISGPVVEVAEALERAAPHLGALIDPVTQSLLGDLAQFDPVEGAPTGSARLASVEASAVERSGVGPGAKQRVETRRVVTVVFADPGATSAADDPPARTAAMSEFFETMRPILERHGATVETFIGDAVMAVFGLPIRHEDDALRAVRAADEMRRTLPDLNRRLSDRWSVEMHCAIGVNSGEVVAGDASTGQRLVTGDVVNVAARLEQAASPGEVLLGALTERLVRGQVETVAVEPLTLKGKSEPVPAFRLESVTASGPRSHRLPLVGRTEELAKLTDALSDAVDAGRLHLATVLGDAGVGKTRLLEEFETRATASGAFVVKGRCLPYGDGITFWPIVEIVRGLADIADGDSPEVATEHIHRLVGSENADVAERLASVIGLTPATFAMSESFWAVRRLCEIVASSRPLVVWLEDLHWAEPTLLDLVDHVARLVTGVPVVVLAAARPSLIETRPDWPPGDDAVRIDLGPLDPEDTARFIDDVLGEARIPPAARERIVEAAQGNPLFIEQLLSMLIDEGRLVKTDDGWSATDDFSTLQIPPSIHALLASRIDRLTTPQRQIVDPASVVGRVFAADAVRHLLDEDPVTAEMPQHLHSLEQRRVVEATTDDESFRFVHLMLRDAAYAGLLKETRAVLHRRFVGWADRVNAESGRSQEFDEILGYHMEQAFGYLRALGPIDDEVAGVGRDGSRRLASAGHRAFARGDMPAAASLIGRSADLLDLGHPDLPWLLLRTGEARFETGDFPGSTEALQRAVAAAEAIGDQGMASAAQAEALRVAYLTGAAGSSAAVEAEVDRLHELLESAHHDSGLARLWRLRMMIAAVAERFGDAEEAALRMIAHASRAGDEVMELRTLQSLAGLAHIGPTPVVEAIRLCEEILERVESDRRAAANTRKALAQLHAMTGDIDTARLLYRGARQTLESLGWAHDAAVVSLDSGPIELLAGDPEVAESELRGDYKALDAMGDDFFKPTTVAYLAEAVYRQGRIDEAETLARESERTADPDDVGPQVIWRSVIAKVLGNRGDEDAVGVAREAIELSMSSDAPLLRADAWLALGEAALALGDASTVAEARREAITYYEAKGSSAGVDRTTRLIGAL